MCNLLLLSLCKILHCIELLLILEYIQLKIPVLLIINFVLIFKKQLHDTKTQRREITIQHTTIQRENQ